MTDLTAPNTVATGLAIQGNVHGGQQPVVGAHVYMMAAGTSGYGGPGIGANSNNASVSVLVPTSTGLSDSIGAYVLTSSTGSFSISGDYTCTAGTQVYLLAEGGNPGAGTNSAASFMAALGQCPSNGSFATTVPYIWMNEVTTVATAYALSGFATDATHISSSNTALAATDISNAFLTTTSLVNVSTGAPLTTTPLGNGTVPVATINTLANIMASCVNSTGPTSTQCSTLFTNAESSGSTGTQPTDTATAMINIAHNPGANVTNLYTLASPAQAFSPALTAKPNDFLVGILYSGTGTAGCGLNGAYAIAIDSHGGVWFTNPNNNAICKLTNTGAPQSPATGFTNPNQNTPVGIAIDTNDNAWVVDAVGSNLVEYSSVGAPLGTFTGGGLHTPEGVAIDGSNNVWVANAGGNDIAEFSSTGSALSPATGFQGGGLAEPVSVAIDSRGYVWAPNKNPAPGTLTALLPSGNAYSSSPFTGGGINSPIGVAIDSVNDVWVSDFGASTGTLSKFNSAGAVAATITGAGLNGSYFIAIDGVGNVWAANYNSNTISEVSNQGNAISPTTGYAPTLVTKPQGIEIDGSGDVWITNFNSAQTTANAVTELIGAAVPRVTPLSLGIKNGTLGTRP